MLTWGNSKFGGTAETALGDANNNLIADSLESGVVDIYGFWDGFIALMHDGTVQAGAAVPDPERSSAVISGLNLMVMVASIPTTKLSMAL